MLHTVMGVSIAIANQKGGVGKTTTAVNLAASLAARGSRILLIDLDPQGNATTNLGARTRDGLSGSYELFSSSESGPIPIACSIPRLHLLPAAMSLAGIEVELATDPGRAHRLRDTLREALTSQYDVLIFDCPPSFGLLTINALAAAEAVLVPLQCEFFALEGLAHLTRTIDAVQRAFNPTLALLGILLTMYDRRNNLSELVAADVRSFFGGKVLETVIPRNVKLSEAPSHGLPISLYDPRSPGALAYDKLALELLPHLARSAAHA